MRVRDGVAVAAVLLAGGALAGCGMNAGLSRDTTRSSRLFSLSGTSLTVYVDNDVTLVPGTAGKVRVQRWLTGKARGQASWQLVHGNQLKVTAPCVGVNLSCGAKYQVAVPPGVTLSVSSASGDVLASGLGNELNVASENGDMSLTTLSGKVRASSDNGDVTARRLRSTDVMASSDNGDVSLGFSTAPRRVAARSSYGNISMTVPNSSYHVTTRTKYGDVSSQLRDHAGAKRTLTADTDNGDVHLSTAG